MQKIYISGVHLVINLPVSVAMLCLFDLILYVPPTIFQLKGMGLPGLNQY